VLQVVVTYCVAAVGFSGLIVQLNFEPTHSLLMWQWWLYPVDSWCASYVRICKQIKI